MFAPGLFPDAKYNDADILPREVGTVMSYNKIVGGIRFRQVRTEPGVGCPEVILNERQRQKANGEVYTEYFVEDCYADPQASSHVTLPRDVT